jgi:photosystem II stability/assembly factor-like uncharacterized protein
MTRLTGLRSVCALVGACALLNAFAPLGHAARVPTEPYAWRNVAIHGGGYVTGLAFHPSAPDLLYARTDVGGAYRWEPARRAWLPLNDGIDRAHAELTGVISLALDPQDANKVYLACGSYFAEWAKPAAVLRSADRGVSWEAVTLPFKLGGNQDGRGTGERLQVDPRDGKIIFLGSNQDGLWRSRDGGRSWSAVKSFPGRGVTFVLFDPRSGAAGKPTPVLYAGAADRSRPGIYRSTDAGKSWSLVPGQPAAGNLVHHAAFDAQGTLWLALGNGPGPNDVTDGAVWKFESASGRWTDVTPEKPDAAVNNKFGYAGLAVHPREPGVVYVSTLDRWARGDEIFRTTDGGATWTPLLARSTFNHVGTPYAKGLKPHWISDLALDPTHPERLWFVTGYGVWATDQAHASLTDPAQKITWLFPNKGLEETVIDELISPPEGASLLSAMGDLGGFRHDDLTVSPRAGVFQPLHGTNPSIAFAERAPAIMVRTHYGPTRGALSRDGGVTWTDFASAPAAATKHGPGIATISADGTRLVWLPKGSKVHVSTDGGATWQESADSPTATTEWFTYGPVADRVNALKFYLYTAISGELYASEDGGVTWEKRQTFPPESGKLRAEPGREGRLWLPTRDGLHVSSDGGRTFQLIAGVTAAHQVGFGAPAAGRTESAVFLDGTVRGESAFFRSDDGGATWVRLSDERLRLGHVRTIIGDARIPGRVYLGTSGRGILVGDPVPAKK